MSNNNDDDVPLDDAARSLFLKSLHAESRREKGELLEFIAKAPRAVNTGLKNIAVRNRQIFEDICRSIIEEVWKCSAGFASGKFQEKIDLAIMDYSLGDDSANFRLGIREQIDRLMQENHVAPTEAQSERLVLEISDEIEGGLIETLLREHLRAHNIPEETVQRLYPPPAEYSVHEALRRLRGDNVEFESRKNADVFYPDAVVPGRKDSSVTAFPTGGKRPPQP